MENLAKYRNVLTIAAGLLLLFGPYQNCSVYKSEGRKFIEDHAVEMISRNATTSEGDTTAATTSEKIITVEHCRPYLPDERAKEIFDTPVELQMLYNDYNKKLTCLVSATTVSTPLTTSACSISQEPVMLLHHRSSFDLKNTFEDPQEELSGGSFAYLAKKEDGTVFLHFIGAQAKAREGVSCRFSFSSAAMFENYREEALLRASQLVHTMGEKVSGL